MSAMTDLESYLLGQTVNVGASGAATQLAVTRAVRTRVFTFMKPGAATSGDDAAAATDTTETPVFVNTWTGTITIKAVYYTCGATAITAGDTHYSTMTLFKRTAAGATQTSLATATTQTTGMGTMTVGQKAAWTLTATLADLTVVTGGILTYTRTHTMNGLVIPGGAICIVYTED